MTMSTHGLPRRRTTPRYHASLRFSLRLFVRLIARVEVEGLENLQQEGAYIGAFNHLSSFDPLIAFVLQPLHPVTIFAAIEHRNDFIMGRMIDRLGAIWIHRDGLDRGALRIALNELACGTVLGVAPEGTRSDTGGLIKGKTGAVYLATRANVPIVPAVLWGTEKIKHNVRRFKRTSIHVRIGEAIRLPEGRAGTKELRAYTDLLMRRLAAMLPPEYRGVYADDVANK